MCLSTKWIFYLSFLTVSSCTDLVAVYKHDVLLLRDVDKTSGESAPKSWEAFVLNVPQPFSYPIGLTYDPKGRRLFVAEAMQDDSKIFSLNLDSDYAVKTMQSVVKTTNTTVMEDLTYDPRTGHLYWTDSYNHGVYKAMVPSEHKDSLAPKPEPAHMFGGVIQPRGIAIDYCNELMYWSERDGSGNIPSSIEVCDLHGPSHKVVQQDGENQEKMFYQGLTFDIMGGKLLWAETIGDDFEKSQCRIVSYEFGQSSPEREILVDLKRCYPFSLTTDDNFIYWADWGQQGIMRASRTNPDDVVKLVHTPQIDSKYGEHHGVYGLEILSSYSDDFILEACKGKRKPNKESAAVQNDGPVNTKSAVAHQKDTSTVGETKSAVQKNEESMTQHDSLPEKVVYPQSQVDLENPISGELQSDDYSVSTNSAPDSSLKLEMKSHMCSENQLLIVVGILVAFCFVFFSSTLALVYKIWFHQRPDLCKAELPRTISNQAVESLPPRQPKRFGPKKKPILNSGPSCALSSSHDGVTINIEDCCQMTECDTPCYTTVKKEGKSYRKNKAKQEDKRGLLDDADDFSNC